MHVGENEDLFGLLMSEIHDCAIVMLDARGMVVSWNDRASEIKGHIAAEIMQQHLSNFYLPSDRDKDKPSCDLAAARRPVDLKMRGGEFGPMDPAFLPM